MLVTSKEFSYLYIVCHNGGKLIKKNIFDISHVVNLLFEVNCESMSSPNDGSFRVEASICFRLSNCTF